MKKILYLLLVLTLASLTSCTGSTIYDEPVRTVDLAVTFQNVATRGENIYVVRDSKFYISPTSSNSTCRMSTPVSKVEYYMDSRLRVRNVFAPFNATFDASTLTSGSHELHLQYEITPSDLAAKNVSKKFNVTVVDSAEQLPDGAVLGDVTRTFTVTLN